MCWSGEASFVLSAIGIGTAVYSAKKKMHPTLWLTLGYFSLMELLQAFTYTVINDCSSHLNQILTLFGYLHICFQPFFINAVSLHFLPNARRKKVQVFAYSMCFATAIIMIMQLYPFDWAGVCHPPEPMCSNHLCSVSGNWHIAWDVPLNGLGWNIHTSFLSAHIGAYYTVYFLAAFVMPFAYGVWRGTIFHLLVGPTLAWATTDNINEWPAIWCLFSIGIVMLIIKVRANPILSEKWLKIKPMLHD